MTIIDAEGRQSVACVHHGARLLAGLDGGRVHPCSARTAAVEVYLRARELPPQAWEVGR